MNLWSNRFLSRIVKIFALTAQGRNPDNFSFVFWEKWWLHKFILKYSDLYLIVIIMTNLYHISLLFTNSKSSDNFCRCKNKRHFFNVNFCTCFNFREILTSVQSHLRKEGVSGTFFRHYNGNRKWCVICTAPYKGQLFSEWIYEVTISS